ncbi:MAG TPA: hypothetical protein VJ984_10415, partial [Xanthomonadales bacterium]|nr:hypothetical protein [Xanthomonadales bacterium]
DRDPWATPQSSSSSIHNRLMGRPACRLVEMRVVTVNMIQNLANQLRIFDTGDDPLATGIVF